MDGLNETLSFSANIYGQGDLQETTSIEMWGFHLLVSSVGRAVFQCNAWLNFQLVTAHLREAEVGKKECRRALEYLKNTIHSPFQLASITCAPLDKIGCLLGTPVYWKVVWSSKLASSEPQEGLVWSCQLKIRFESHISIFILSPKFILCSMYCIFYGHFLMLEMQFLIQF